MPGVKRKAGFSRVIVKPGRRRAFPARAHLASMATELKYHDAAISSGNLVTNTDASAGERDPAVGLSLNSIGQGTGDSERDGRRITITHVRVQGFIREDEVLTSLVRAPQQYFVALVLDKQTNGAQLKSEDVFKNIGATTTTGTDLMANLKFSKRFAILGMKRLTYGNNVPIATSPAAGSNAYNGVLSRFTFNKRMKLSVLYSESGNTIASIVDNSLHVIAFCVDTTEPTPKLSYVSRIRFVG